LSGDEWLERSGLLGAAAVERRAAGTSLKPLVGVERQGVSNEGRVSFGRAEWAEQEHG
jgi:hypothetical protein